MVLVIDKIVVTSAITQHMFIFTDPLQLVCSEMHLSEARQTGNEDYIDEELPSTSGRPFGEVPSLTRCFKTSKLSTGQSILYAPSTFK